MRLPVVTAFVDVIYARSSDAAKLFAKVLNWDICVYDEDFLHAYKK